MKTWNFDNVNMTPDMIQVYFAQEMALLMQRQTAEIERQGRLINNLWERDRESLNTTNLALELMVQRETVLATFAGQSHLSMTQLQQRLSRAGIRCWTNTLPKAIELTDYLVCTPHGSGFSVWKAEDYNAKTGTA